MNDRAAAREALLWRIVNALQAHAACRAAWLTGSFGRGEQDDLSDLDLTVAVGDRAAGAICRRPWQIGAGAPPERDRLFRRFGEIGVIHENHYNAPPGGTFSFVLYADSALTVDWILVPESVAHRPRQSVVLFDRSGIPVREVAPDLDEAQQARRSAERTAYFWMLASAAAKYILRGDAVYAHILLDGLSRVLDEVRALHAGSPAPYRRGSNLRLAPAPTAQRASLVHLCQDMTELHPEWNAMPAVERILAIAEVESRT